MCVCESNTVPTAPVPPPAPNGGRRTGAESKQGARGWQSTTAAHVGIATGAGTGATLVQEALQLEPELVCDLKKQPYVSHSSAGGRFGGRMGAACRLNLASVYMVMVGVVGPLH